jgi:hypothetical protein
VLQDPLTHTLEVLAEPWILKSDALGVIGLALRGRDEGLERLKLMGEARQLLALARLVGACDTHAEEQ